VPVPAIASVATAIFAGWILLFAGACLLVGIDLPFAGLVLLSLSSAGKRLAA
jgi:hypothetical protein